MQINSQSNLRLSMPITVFYVIMFWIGTSGQLKFCVNKIDFTNMTYVWTYSSLEILNSFIKLLDHVDVFRTILGRFRLMNLGIKVMSHNIMNDLSIIVEKNVEIIYHFTTKAYLYELKFCPYIPLHKLQRELREDLCIMPYLFAPWLVILSFINHDKKKKRKVNHAHENHIS